MLMVAIDIKHDLEAVRRELAGIPDRVIKQAAARALNRTGAQVRTAAAREMAATTGLKKGDISRAIRQMRAKAQSLTYQAVGRGRPFNLARFRARQQKRGVKARPWKKPVLIRGAWLGNNNRTVFKRVGVNRMPIRGVYGPGVANELVREAVTRATRARFAEQWPKNFAADLRFFMNRYLERQRARRVLRKA